MNAYERAVSKGYPKILMPHQDKLIEPSKDFMEGYFQALGAIQDLMKEEKSDFNLDKFWSALYDVRMYLFNIVGPKTDPNHKGGLLWD